ncbi:MAG: hypothetical protein WDA42_00875 [Candidatus Bathyarchaeia archaeon]
MKITLRRLGANEYGSPRNPDLELLGYLRIEFDPGDVEVKVNSSGMLVALVPCICERARTGEIVYTTEHLSEIMEDQDNGFLAVTT